MKKTAATILAAALQVAICSLSIFAQADPKPAPVVVTTAGACPTITMAAPTAAVFVPQPLTFTATVNAAEPNATPLYNWLVSAGTIVSGQGTPSIKVDTTDAGPYGSVTATLLITGYNPNCPVSASATVEVKLRPVARKFDEFAELKPADEEAKLEAVKNELEVDPDLKLYLIVYRGTKTKPGATEPILQRANTFLTTKGIVQERIERIYGERRDPPAIEIWFVPSGAPPPKPTVTVVSKPAVQPKKP